MESLKIGFDFDGVMVFWLFFPKRNSKKVLKLLIEQGHLVKVVTARGNFLTLFLAKATLKIFRFPNFPIVGVGKNGQKYKELLGFDIFVDNKAKHLIDVDGKVKHLFVFSDRPKSGFSNVADWWEIFWKVIEVGNKSI